MNATGALSEILSCLPDSVLETDVIMHGQTTVTMDDGTRVLVVATII
jgi:hypothetical protein